MKIPIAIPAGFIMLLLSFQVHAQKIRKADKLTLTNLREHIHYLADDKLEGRRAGSAGEKLASDYILLSFEKAGLQPHGEGKSWLQPFEINEGKQVNPETICKINGKVLLEGKEYFPLAWSAEKTISGEPAIALQEQGLPWFVDLKDILEANQGNPHFDLETFLHTRVKETAQKGATAIIFFNSSSIADNLSFNKRDKSDKSLIPVICLTAEGRKKYLKDESASIEMNLTVSISEKKRYGHNVIGYIDNGAAETIVLGAHYDHLGYGEDSNSLYRGAEKQIHHGADDNASGTAALIELARLIKLSKLKNRNYLFIAFSGEELGLFGSKYFVEHPTIDLSKVDYMLNMDMVGRLNDSSHVITIGGYGTSPEWGTLFASSSSKNYLQPKFDSSGTGPSDHTSFYRKDIPVLFFFTGLHKDYHRPTDIADNINYEGELQVVKYIYSLVEQENGKSKLAFTKTRETQTTTSARFSVTLGIMPDYTFSGTGVRIDGISEGKAAFRAGLKAGDVIIQLGSYPVSSMENYMQVLSRFKKGDSTQVKYLRGTNVAESPVQF